MKRLRGLRFNSLIVAIILSLSILTVRFTQKRADVLTWDVFGYYLYLPAHFIYDDPHLTDHKWLDNITENYTTSPTLYQLVDMNDGKRMIKYSSGMALLYSPFFFIAHGIAPLTGYPADGFSFPYQLLILIGSTLWSIAGIFLLLSLLRKFFSELVATIALILVGAGTNYFQIAAIDGTLLTHNYLFTLYIWLILSTVNWHRNPTFKQAISIGISGGLISLVRPSEAVCFLIPLLWYTGNKEFLKQKVKLIKLHKLHLLAVLIPAIIIGSLQFFYWKSVTGEWLYYSYSNNPGEGFRFFPPYIIEFLFSFRKGWFVYTPIMLFAIIGLIPMIRKERQNVPAIILFLILDFWIMSAWTAWWYGGGSFSARSAVPAYPLLAIPLGYLVQWVLSSRIGVIGIIAGCFFVLLNLFQSWQWKEKIIDKDRMTGKYYFAIFGRTSVDKEKLDHLLMIARGTETNETPSHIERYIGKIIFQTPTVSHSDTTDAIAMGPENPFSQGIDIQFKDLTNKDHVWIKSSGEVWLPEGYEGTGPLLVHTFHYKGEAYKYRATKLENLLTGRWQLLEYWYLSPEVRSAEDNLKVYFWQPEPSRIYVRNLKIEVFELKN